MLFKATQEAQKIRSKCAVLFFDEIDALGQSRGGHGLSSMAQGASDGCSRRVLAELLIQLNRINSRHLEASIECQDSMDKYCDDHPTTVNNESSITPKDRVRIIVVAATNRLEDCDSALIRRFAIRVVVGLPSLHDRKRIIKRFLKGVENSVTKKQLGDIAAATEGLSGADLEHLTREAAMAPVRECIHSAELLKKRHSSHPQEKQNIEVAISDGTGTAQEERTNALHSVQQEKLLEHFRELRRVTYEDFRSAIEFWIHNQNPNAPQSEIRKQSPTSVVLTDYDSDEDD